MRRFSAQRFSSLRSTVIQSSRLRLSLSSHSFLLRTPNVTLSFSTSAKFFGKEIFLTTWYAHTSFWKWYFQIFCVFLISFFTNTNQDIKKVFERSLKYTENFVFFMNIMLGELKSMENSHKFTVPINPYNIKISM